MPDLENELKITNTKKSDHQKLEKDINHHFANPLKRYVRGIEYDCSLGNFPLSRQSALNFIRQICSNCDFSTAIVGDVTVVIEHKMVFSGAANDFFEKAFKTIYPLDVFMISGSLFFFQKEGMAHWSCAQHPQGVDTKPSTVLIPFQGKLVLGSLESFRFELKGGASAVRNVKYALDAKKRKLEKDDDVKVVAEIDLTVE